MLETRDVPGKGRGVFASRDITAGEVVLSERPLLLYPQHCTAAAFCSHCLRAFNSLDDAGASVTPCNSCGRVGFCNAACAVAAAADPGSHCPAVCRLLAACNITGLSDEQQSALQLLFRCCSLRHAAAAGNAAAAARFAAIASLSAPPPLPSVAANQHPPSSSNSSSSSLTGHELVQRELHGRLVHALSAAGVAPAAALLLQEVSELLRKDATNGYGIMAPSAPDGERRIRGTALYAHASLINHECLPNVARFDRFDASSAQAAPPGANTVVEFRALHDIPAGEEVTQSYFPLPWPLADRQQRCQEDYAFECTCPRCKEEATWSEEESEGEWETDEDAGMEDAAAADAVATDGAGCSHHQGGSAAAVTAILGEQQQQQDGGARADPAYINLFLLKYVCPREGCYGTMAPLAPPGAADVYECNMCGGRRTEADFLAELEAAD